LKRDIVDLSEKDGLTATLKLHPVRFHWKDPQQDKDEGEQIGLIAQDVEKVFPVGVTGNYGDAVVHLGDGRKETVYQARKLDYGRLVSPIVKAIQQLSGKLEQLISDPVWVRPVTPVASRFMTTSVASPIAHGCMRVNWCTPRALAPTLSGERR
jgi:hypothetical protein